MCPRPRSRICGSSCWHRRAALKVWVIISRCSSAGSVSTTVFPRLATPALWTMMSTKPNAASAASASASAPSRSDERRPHGQRAAARGLDRRHGLRGGRLVAAVVDHDRGAGGGQLLGDPAADAPAGSGNDGHTAGKRRHAG